MIERSQKGPMHRLSVTHAAHSMSWKRPGSRGASGTAVANFTLHAGALHVAVTEAPDALPFPARCAMLMLTAEETIALRDFLNGRES